jgi:hypothetical protein
MLSRHRYQMHNPTRIATHFEWQIPPRFADAVSITPSCGVLGGNETTEVCVEFAPKTIKVGSSTLGSVCQSSLAFAINHSLFMLRLCILHQAYDMKMRCVVSCATERAEDTHAGVSSAPRGVVSLRARGRCISGVVEFDPPLVDFATVPLHTAEVRHFTIRNRCDW